MASVQEWGMVFLRAILVSLALGFCLYIARGLGADDVTHQTIWTVMGIIAGVSVYMDVIGDGWRLLQGAAFVISFLMCAFLSGTGLVPLPFNIMLWFALIFSFAAVLVAYVSTLISDRIEKKRRQSQPKSE